MAGVYARAVNARMFEDHLRFANLICVIHDKK